MIRENHRLIHRGNACRRKEVAQSIGAKKPQKSAKAH